MTISTSQLSQANPFLLLLLQESTAHIEAVGDAEDVTNDPEPVMVRLEETDAMVQLMLDKEVGTARRTWDNQLLGR